jgi:hypothetical protein
MYSSPATWVKKVVVKPGADSAVNFAISEKRE